MQEKHKDEARDISSAQFSSPRPDTRRRI